MEVICVQTRGAHRESCCNVTHPCPPGWTNGYQLGVPFVNNSRGRKNGEEDALPAVVPSRVSDEPSFGERAGLRAGHHEVIEHLDIHEREGVFQRARQ